MSDVFDLDLTPFGAPGFTLGDRVDFSGHKSGTVDPHMNSDIINPQGRVLRREGPADFRDIVHNQLPGFNGMQEK